MSQFADIFKAVKADQPNVEPPNQKKQRAAPKQKAAPAASKTATKTTQSKKTVAANSQTGVAATPTRQTGKSSSAEYTQVLTYLRKDTHKAVKRALLDFDDKRDLSDIVEELLIKWLDEQD